MKYIGKITGEMFARYIVFLAIDNGSNDHHDSIFFHIESIKILIKPAEETAGKHISPTKNHCVGATTPGTEYTVAFRKGSV